jgi:hypothetical protein
MMKVLSLLILLISLNAFAESVFKCTDKDGNMIFSDKSCSENSEVIEVTPPAKQSDHWSEYLKKRKSKLFQKVKAEIELCGDYSLYYLQKAWKAQNGMTKNEIRYVMGSPRRVNTSAYGPEQWVYPHGSYVYFEGGCVVNWSR